MKNEFNKFLAEESLYTPFVYEHSSFLEFLKLENSIDCFCEGCKRESVFLDVVDISLKDEIYTLQFSCARDKSHKITFVVLSTPNGFEKIAQVPPSISGSLSKTEKYRDLIGDEYYDEYLKGINSYNNGMAVGAFIYFKRILEMLIFDKFALNMEEVSIPLADFRKLSFGEKLKKLEKFLPRIFMQNIPSYEMVSRHIHDLSEEDCRAYFPFLRSTLELILDDTLFEIEQMKKREEFASFLNSAIK